ncbi:MAG: PKD domain-containing protein [Solirubrobacterales bacterium]
MFRINFAVIVAALGLLAFAQTAAADDYCAGSSAHCLQANTFSGNADGTGITAAINAAHSHAGDDHVWIAAGSYDITSTTFPTFGGAAGDKLDISGAGVGQTIINGPAGSQGLINLILPTTTSTLSDVTLNVTLTGIAQLGISMGRGNLADFELNLLNPDGYYTAIAVQMLQPNLALSRGKITTVQGLDRSVTGVDVVGTTTTASVTDLEIVGPNVSSTINPGIQLEAGSLIVSRTKVSGFARGINAGNGTLTVLDSIIDLGSRYGGTGFRIKDSADSIARNVTATLRRNTVVGIADTQVGISTGRLETGDQTTLDTLENAIYLTGTNVSPLICDGTVNGLYDNNNAFRGTPTITGGCSVTSSAGTISLSSSPFVGIASGDLRPSSTSPLIDAGSSVNNVPGSGDLDFGHRPRLVNGDGLSGSRVDIGAYEYQRAAPTVALTTPKETLAPLESATFTAAAEDIDGDSLTYSWTIDGDASSVDGSTYSGAFAGEGAHTVSVTVTDETGQSDTTTKVVTVAKPPILAPICPVPALSAKIKTKPSRPFKIAGKGFALAKSKAKQPFIGVIAPASDVKITLQSVGRKNKLKSLKGSQTIKLKNANPKLTFGGKWNKKKLKAGKYRATITILPADSCTVVTSTTVNLKLR